MIATASWPEKDEKSSSDCEHAREDIICAERLADRQAGGDSEGERIADNERDLRERKSERAPTDKQHCRMEPRLLAELRDATDDEKKSDSADSYGLKTKDSSAEKNNNKIE
jgi:hypothetical protein